MAENLHRLQTLITAEAACTATAASFGEEVDCVAVFATTEQWRAVRVLAADVAARAAYLGYASDRFEAWQVSAQRRAMGPWPPGDAQLLLTLQQGHSTVRQWLAAVPASVFAPSDATGMPS